MIEKLGGRKVILGLLIIILGVAIEALLKNGLTANVLTLLLGIYGAFAVGNGAEHISTAISTKDNSVTYTSLESVEKLQQVQSESLDTIQKALSFIIDKAGFSSKK